MQLLQIIAAFAAVGLTWYIGSLVSTYLQARKMGFPIVITPVNPHSVPWMIFSVPLQPFFKRFLPTSIFVRIELSTIGFEHRVRNMTLERFGPSYVLVGPGAMEFWTTDLEIAKAVANNKDVPLSTVSKKFMDRFGTSVLTAQGESWQRQRRIIAPIINEGISKSVWQEGIKQAFDMLDSYTANPANGHANGSAKIQVRSGTTNESIEGLRRIAINVLNAVGYGKPQEWGEKENKAPTGYKLSYTESLFAIINNMAAAAFVPPWLLHLPVFPSKVRSIGTAVEEYPRHTRSMVAHERITADPSKNNMMSVIVRLSDQEKKANTKPAAKSRLYLSEEEILGNLFIFTLAGFDTTANTMAYALTNLAMYPQWQDWIIEEIDHVMPNTTEQPPYDKTFPHLKRVLALMFETLRLYTPVVHLAREPFHPLTLTSSKGTQHTIPAHTDMFVSMSMIHVDPTRWAPDPVAFRPSRWLTAQTVQRQDGTSEVVETLIEPAKGTFMPWSTGPRYCPGMKMSQVEFVSVFASLFARARVEPVVGEGKTLEEARVRLGGVLEDSVPLIALQMNRPRDVVLRWVRRD